MISYQEANLSELSIHHVGNAANDEYFSLSEQSIHLTDETLIELLKTFFLTNLQKSNEVYRFLDTSETTTQNSVFQIVKDVFGQKVIFHDASKQLAKNLFDLGTNPKIKAGELYVVYFENLQLEGDLHDAIGIFKSETKEPFLKVSPHQNNFEIQYEQQGINLNKIDRACVILNTESELGYKVLAIDQGKSATGSFWKDEFLQLKIRNDNFTQTQTIMGVYKSFVTEKLDEEFEVERTDKIDLLNRSMKYFKEKDQFDIDEFSNEVIANEEGIALFKSYKQSLEEALDEPIADTFTIADAAVKKQAKDFKSILKLDKNFHVYIHGNKELIVKEFDEEKGMNCYKLFFKEEN
jgi:hypothetical protein